MNFEKINYRHRIDLLRGTHAAIKFLSMEPLLSGVSGMNLSGIDWVIVGGESGPGARMMQGCSICSIGVGPRN